MSAESKLQMPTFANAVEQYREFLVSQQISSQLLWVFREDVTSHKRRVFVKESLPPENEQIVARLYKIGCQRGLGVQLDVFCLLHSRPCCYILLPKDEFEAECKMIGGLKLSVPTELIQARSVTSNFLWNFKVWL